MFVFDVDFGDGLQNAVDGGANGVGFLLKCGEQALRIVLRGFAAGLQVDERVVGQGGVDGFVLFGVIVGGGVWLSRYAVDGFIEMSCLESLRGWGKLAFESFVFRK